MATVYKAKCHVLNRYVAVKVLKDEFTTDEEFIKRFNIEAQSAAGLTHPNIVSVYDVGHEENIYYIVMELIQGKTLKEIISEEGSLPWKWSINIVIQIASALEAAHKNNIVHRDIKPHNIIITEDGIAKVTDFGIAKAVSNSTITAFGTTIGSVHYFSPEHARGGYTDAKSDLYSLGVVMYEMLTGRVPFDADTPVSIALKHMQEKPVEPMKLNPSIPFAVNQIIMKAMQKEPSLRYQSATEMLKDLSMAIKNPEGEFVKESAIDNTATQRMKAVTDDMLDKEKDKKKEGKLKKYFKKHPKMKIAIIVLSFVLIFIIAAVSAKLIMDATAIKDIQIPELVGKTEQEVIEILKDTKLEYEIIKEEYNSEIEAGKVILQEPPYKKNYTIKENTKISLTISKGVEKVIVPKVAGMEYDKAVEDLTKAKLIAEKIEEKSEKVQEGYVISQETPENTEVNAGDTVKLHVSIGTGIEKVSVPYVIGKSQDEAISELTNAKLKTEVITEEDKTKNDGEVLKQSKTVGEVVDEGTTIIITVNKIAEMKTGTVNINVKKLTDYKQEVDKDNKPIAAPKVGIKVVVDDKDTIYNETKSSDTEKVTLSVEGIGTVNVKVYIRAEKAEEYVLKAQTNMNLNTGNATWTAE